MDTIHNYNTIGLEKTRNGFGYMHKASEITKKFIDLSKTANQTLLDIGCAYGVATIPCLMNGAQVFGCDIDNNHLEIMKKRVPEAFIKNLETVNKKFPYQTDFLPNTFDGILISHVLSFLSPQEIFDGIMKVFNWLKSDGKLFILNYTPFHKSLKNFIPIYEEKKRNGDKWPGLIMDKDCYGDSIYLKENLPDNLILFDTDMLLNLFSTSKFLINDCYYLGSSTEFVPEPFRLDGREWVGLIATKPGQ
jgi:SAM-dependent methyltransferase